MTKKLILITFICLVLLFVADFFSIEPYTRDSETTGVDISELNKVLVNYKMNSAASTGHVGVLQNQESVKQRLGQDPFFFTLDDELMRFEKLMSDDEMTYVARRIDGEGLITLTLMDDVIFGFFTSQRQYLNFEVTSQGTITKLVKPVIDKGGERLQGFERPAYQIKARSDQCVNC